MTPAQTLELRSSAIRSRLNAINSLAGDAYTDAIRAESDVLTTEYTDVETRHRAAMVIEGDERQVAEREAAKIGRLRAIPNSANGSNCGAVRGSVGSWRRPFQAVRSTAPKPSIGRAWGLATVFRLTCSRRTARRCWSTAPIAATVAPSDGTGRQRSGAPAVTFFPSRIAPMLGIDMPQVGSGSHTEARISCEL